MEFDLRVRNSLDSDLTMYLEPWGEQYTIGPRLTLTVHAKGPRTADLEIEYGEGTITIYGWSGSILSIAGETVSK